MKITVPDFVTEENVQETVKGFVKKNLPLDARFITATATARALMEQLKLGGGADSAGTLPPPDIDALGELGKLLPELTQEELEFVEAPLLSRGMKFTSNDVKFASDAMELIRQHPKKEMEITLPDGGEV